MSEDLNALWDEAEPIAPVKKTEDLNALWDEAEPEKEPSLWEKTKEGVKDFFTPVDNYEFKRKTRDSIDSEEDGISKSIGKAIYHVSDFISEPYDKTFKSPQTRDEEYDREKVSDIVSQVRNTSDSSLYSTSASQLLETLKISDMSKEQKEEFSNLQQQDVKNISKVLKDRKMGFIGTNDKGTYTYVSPDGRETQMGDLDSIWSDLQANKWESGGAIAGAMRGAAMAPSHPFAKVAGGLLGGAVGAFAGRGSDYVENAVKANQEIDFKKMGGQMVESAIADPVMTLLTAGAFKLAAKPAKAIKRYIADGNIDQAIKTLEDSGMTYQDAKELAKKAQSYHDGADVSKARDVLAENAISNPHLAGEVKKSLETYPGVAPALSESVEKRADNLISSMESKGVDDQVLKLEFDTYEKATSLQYKETKDLLIDATPDYRFDFQKTDIPDILDDISKSIGEETAQTEIKSILHVIGKNDSIGTEQLLKLRERINKVLRKPSMDSYDDISAFKKIKQTLDGEIDIALNSARGDIPKKEIKAQWDKSLVEYSAMKRVQESTPYQKLMHEDATGESVDKAFSSAAKSLNGTFSKLSSVLSESVREKAEHRVLLGFIKSSTKTINEKRAIDFTSLAKDLDSINMDNITAKSTRENITIIKDMAKLFGQDTKLQRMATTRSAQKLNQGISQDLTARLKTMLANRTTNFIIRYLPNNLSANAPFRMHIAKSLKNTRTPKEFLDEISNIDEVPKEFISTLKPMVVASEKIRVKEKELAEKEAQKQIKRDELQARREVKKAKGSQIHNARSNHEQVKNFITPDIHEIQAVEKLNKNDNKYKSFSQTLVKIQDGTATKKEIRDYLNAKKYIDDDALSSLQSTLKQQADDDAIMIAKRKEQNELDALYEKKNLTEEELKRASDLDKKINPNDDILFAKGGDNLAAGMFAGIEEDENGNYAFNSEKFILGLGGYTVAKELLKRGNVPQQLKSMIEKSLPKVMPEGASMNAMSPERLQNKQKKNILKVINDEKPSTQVGKTDDGDILTLEKGQSWLSKGEIKGYGLEKIYKKHIEGQKDILMDDVINSSVIREQSEMYSSKGNVVFDFPNKKESKFRIVFGDKVDDNKEAVLLPNGQKVLTAITMFQRGVDGRLNPIIPNTPKKGASVSPSSEISDLHSTSKDIIADNIPKAKNSIKNKRNLAIPLALGATATQEVEAEPKGVYVDRKVQNNAEIHDWAKLEGFNPVEAKDMHTTIVYSKNNVKIDPETHKVVIPKEQITGIKKLGDEGAIVMTLKSDDLVKRWEQTQKDGATWDHDSYQPHITISYDGFKGDLKDVKLPQFDIELKGESVSQLNQDTTGTSAYIGNQEINMKNNEILKDGKLTKNELVSLIEHAPNFQKHLATFGDIESEGKDKVMERLLTMFNDEDPVTALAMVAENFYAGDDKKFITAISDKKIESVSNEWVQSILDIEPERKRVDTPVADGHFNRMLSDTFQYLDLDAIEGTTLTSDDGRGRTAWGGVDKIHSPREFAMLKNGEIEPSAANSMVMSREAKVTYRKLPWLTDAKQITQEIASILAMNVGGTGATKFAPTFKKIERGDITAAIRGIKKTRLTNNHKKHIVRALKKYKMERA